MYIFRGQNRARVPLTSCQSHSTPFLGVISVKFPLHTSEGIAPASARNGSKSKLGQSHKHSPAASADSRASMEPLKGMNRENLQKIKQNI